jgi:hypothetical protein
MTMDWRRLLCSQTILDLRRFSVGVSSLGRLRSFKISYISPSPRSPFLDEKETDFPFDIFLKPRNHNGIFSFLQSPPCPLTLQTASVSFIF